MRDRWQQAADSVPGVLDRGGRVGEVEDAADDCVAAARVGVASFAAGTRGEELESVGAECGVEGQSGEGVCPCQGDGWRVCDLYEWHDGVTKGCGEGGGWACGGIAFEYEGHVWDSGTGGCGKSFTSDSSFFFSFTNRRYKRLPRSVI